MATARSKSGRLTGVATADNTVMRLRSVKILIERYMARGDPDEVKGRLDAGEKKSGEEKGDED